MGGLWKKSGTLTGLCLLAVFTLASEARETNLGTRTTSASGRFVIYSKDPTRRMNLSQRADGARKQWLSKAGEQESAPPVIIQDSIGATKPRNNAGVLTRVFEGDGGVMKVQVDIYDASVFQGQTLEMEIYRALALNEIYRDHPPKAGKAFRSPPSWLLEGLCEEGRIQENGPPTGLYATLLKSENPPRLEDFLKSKPELMDATSLTLYRTQALALLKTLQQLSEGPKGLAAFLQALPETNNDLKGLLTAYPSLEGSASRLGKLWTLSIARSSASKGLDPDSIGETARALRELLEVSAPMDPKKPDLGKVTGAAAFPAIARGAGGAYLMRQKSAEFMTLEFRAHPLLRPVIAEYRNITTQLAAKPKKNLGKQIEENGKILALLLQRSDQVADYLNWFEATQLDTLSGNFLEAATPLAVPARTDPISFHLDGIENRGW